VEAEPVLVDAARRLDPPRLRRLVTHLRLVADPDSERDRAQRRHEQRGLWLSPTLDNMIAVDGLLEAEAGQTLLAALEPLARPASAGDDPRSGGQRQADALTELARRSLEGGRLPRTGGVRPQLTVLVDLDSLQGRHPLGGHTDLGALDPEACRRLACDSAVTRVLVTRHHPQDHPGHHHHGDDGDGGLATRLQTAAALLPPILGGAPSQPLDLGRTTRVVTPTQRIALAVRDGAACSRAVPAPWPGAKPTTCGTGWTVARPTWPTWCCCAGLIIGPSMTAAGSLPDNPKGG